MLKIKISLLDFSNYNNIYNGSFHTNLLELKLETWWRVIIAKQRLLSNFFASLIIVGWTFQLVKACQFYTRDNVSCEKEHNNWASSFTGMNPENWKTQKPRSFIIYSLILAFDSFSIGCLVEKNHWCILSTWKILVIYNCNSIHAFKTNI